MGWASASVGLIHNSCIRLSKHSSPTNPHATTNEQIKQLLSDSLSPIQLTLQFQAVMYLTVKQIKNPTTKNLLNLCSTTWWAFSNFLFWIFLKIPDDISRNFDQTKKAKKWHSKLFLNYDLSSEAVWFNSDRF